MKTIPGFSLKFLLTGTLVFFYLGAWGQKIDSLTLRPQNPNYDIRWVSQYPAAKEKEKSGLRKNNEMYITAKNYLRRHLPEKEDFQTAAKEIEKRLLGLGKDIKKLGGPLDTKKFAKIGQKESELLDKFSDTQKEEVRLESILESETGLAK